MSIESAKAFVERMLKDQEFATQINACRTMDEVQNIAKTAGFDFTESELHECHTQLAEDELGAVTGGGDGYPHGCPRNAIGCPIGFLA